MKTYDVIIIGLGTAGAAACMSLARRGRSVLGIDKFRPPHRLGSHHGASRSVRRAYLEGSSYVPMAMWAWQLWRKLERDSGQHLLATTGNLTIGQENGPAISGFLASARSHSIPHRCMTAREIRHKWPELQPPDSLVGGLEIEAGIVLPERSITAFLDMADKGGAHLLRNEEVVRLQENTGTVTVSTSTRTVEAGRVLVAAGAWSPSLLRLPGRHLQVKRVPVHWFARPKGGNYRLGHFPVNFWQLPVEKYPDFPADQAEFYSLPITEGGGGIKVAFHNGLDDCDPDTVCRQARDMDEVRIREVVARYLPGLQDSTITSEVCLYTMSSDGHFFLGRRPGSDNVFGVTLSGHGFKFAPVLGEILADLLDGCSPAFDLGLFSPTRFIG